MEEKSVIREKILVGREVKESARDTRWPRVKRKRHWKEILVGREVKESALERKILVGREVKESALEKKILVGREVK